MTTINTRDDDCNCEPKWLQLLLAFIAAAGGVLAEKTFEAWLDSKKSKNKKKKDDDEDEDDDKEEGEKKEGHDSPVSK